jgi:acyl-CoA hydrolase
MATSIADLEFTQLASEEQIAKTVQAVEAHGIRAVVFESGQEARSYVLSLDRVTQRNEMRKLGASPDVLVGSVHAVTERGEIMIASATGSQLGPAASGAGKVIWVVGTHKLVHTLEDGLRRIREHSLPLESERTKEVYGQASAINKLLIVSGEAYPGRITIVLVKQLLGF